MERNTGEHILENFLRSRREPPLFTHIGLPTRRKIVALTSKFFLLDLVGLA